MKFKINKAQLSIFILIAVMILFLFVFLISTDSSDKVQRINENKNSLSEDMDSKLYSLKDNVDYCLEKELRKGLILAGARGGFIYKYDGEYFFNGVIPSDIYTGLFLNHLDLSRTAVKDRTLVYKQDNESDYVPILENSSVISKFNHTVKQDLERYILGGFIDCLDIEELERRGYELEYERFNGKIISILSSDRVIVEGIIGKKDDLVSVDISDKLYFGKIISLDLTSKTTTIQFSSSLPTFGVDLRGKNVLNYNTSVKLNVIFHEEQTSAKLDFPITISKNNFSSSYKQSQVTLNVRFNKLLDMAKSLRKYKYYHEHTINITDRVVLNRFFRGNYNYRNGDAGPVDKYFSKTSFNDFSIRKTVLPVTTQSYIAEVYTIIDRDSKILGKDYIFNFGYENHAPILNLSLLNLPPTATHFANNSVILFTVVGDETNFNLKNISRDPQAIDNDGSLNPLVFNHIYFKNMSVDDSNVKFRLYSNGTLIFMAKRDGTYVYNIEVTDGEAKNFYYFKFISGAGSNANNSASPNCFNFDYFDHPSFPVDDRFKTIFSYVDSAGITQAYAFANKIDLELGTDLSLSGRNTLTFTCFPQTAGLHDVTYSFNGQNQGPLPQSGEILISSFDQSNTQLNISVRITDKITNQLLGEPYNISIYFVPCLGVVRDVEESCCIMDLSMPYNDTDPTSFVNSVRIDSSSQLTPVSLYFTFSPQIDSFRSLPVDVDVTNDILWFEKKHDISQSIDPFNGPEITSVFEGKLKFKCRGYLPTKEDNIEKIERGSPTGPVWQTSVLSYTLSGHEAIISPEDASGNSLLTPYFDKIPVDLSLVSATKMCEFSYFDDETQAQLKVLLKIPGTPPKGLAMMTAPSDDPSILHSPVPTDYTVEVLCDRRWYGKETGGGWNLGSSLGPTFSKGGSQKTVEKSRGYCTDTIDPSGGYVCEGRNNGVENNYDSKTDHTPMCTDYYLNYCNWDVLCMIQHAQAPAGGQGMSPKQWQCGSYTYACKGCTSSVVSSPNQGIGGCLSGNGAPVTSTLYCGGSYSCVPPRIPASCSSCIAQAVTGAGVCVAWGPPGTCPNPPRGCVPSPPPCIGVTVNIGCFDVSPGPQPIDESAR